MCANWFPAVSLYRENTHSQFSGPFCLWLMWGCHWAVFTPSPFDGARLAAQVSKLCPQESDEERATKERVADHIGEMGLIDYCGACECNGCNWWWWLPQVPKEKFSVGNTYSKSKTLKWFRKILSVNFNDGWYFLAYSLYQSSKH